MHGIQSIAAEGQVRPVGYGFRFDAIVRQCSVQTFWQFTVHAVPVDFSQDVDALKRHILGIVIIAHRYFGSVTHFDILVGNGNQIGVTVAETADFQKAEVALPLQTDFPVGCLFRFQGGTLPAFRIIVINVYTEKLLEGRRPETAGGAVRQGKVAARFEHDASVPRTVGISSAADEFFRCGKVLPVVPAAQAEIKIFAD